jgi:hypothetical protein
MTNGRAFIALGFAADAAAACSTPDAEPDPRQKRISCPRDLTPRDPASILASWRPRLGAAPPGIRHLLVGALLLTLATACGSAAAEPSPPIARDVTVRVSWHLIEGVHDGRHVVVPTQ